ncbi:MAG: tetratricopeptide repeat protein [Rhodospirillaceae bacterium]
MAAAVSGCAGDPFDGIARPHPADRSPEKPDAAKVAALVRVADATAAAGDLASATAMYRRAYEADPLNAEVMQRLGETLLHLGEHDEAARVFRKAAANGPNAEALRGLARALIGLDQPRAAISQLEAALEIAESVNAYNAMGVAYDLLGDHGAAQAFYRTGLDVDAANAVLQNNLGLSLAVSGRHEEAISVLRRSARSPGATARQRLNLALAYGLAGEMSAAAETARIDLDERSVEQNLAFYATLRALRDSRETIRAIGAHNAAFGGAAYRGAPRERAAADGTVGVAGRH